MAIWIKIPDVYQDKDKKKLLTIGENRSVILESGDGMIYKGCRDLIGGIECQNFAIFTCTI